MSFIQELKRRNVFRIGIAYAVVAWLLIQVVSEVAGPLHLPEWTESLVIVLLGVGFPVALILAWAFELTPDGVKREQQPGVEGSQEKGQPNASAPTGRQAQSAVLVLVLLGAGYFALDRLVLSPDSVPSAAEPSISSTVAESSTQDTEKSIAVLPFENVSRDAANEPFTIGIHDDLLTNLAKIESIRTISRTSVMQYRDRALTVPEIARELGVATVLEGGVQRVGDNVRINVQLIDAATDKQLWAETYDRQLSAVNIFQIQTGIAVAIADALRAKLSPREQQRLESIPTENLLALEAYFSGRQALSRRTSGALREAADYFNTAIELDPDFALPYVGLADSLTLQIEYAGLPFRETNQRAAQLVNRALLLDADSGEAYASLGIIKRESDHDEAEAAFLRSLELSPNYVYGHHWYGLFLRFLGRYEDGLVHTRQALALDPRSRVVQVNLGTVLNSLGRTEEAIVEYQKALDMDSAYPGAHWSLGGIYWTRLNQLQQGLDWLESGFELGPSDASVAAWIGLLQLDNGNELDATRWIEHAKDLGPESVNANWAMELLMHYRGQPEVAREYASKVLAQDSSWPFSQADLRNGDLQAGRASDAASRYQAQFPELFADQIQPLDRTNVQAAIDLAPVMMAMDMPERSEQLLTRAMAYAKSSPVMGEHYYTFDWGISYTAQIYALRGDTQAAINTLVQAGREGRRALWWYWLHHAPNLEPIRQDPQFNSLIEEFGLGQAMQ